MRDLQPLNPKAAALAVAPIIHRITKYRTFPNPPGRWSVCPWVGAKPIADVWEPNMWPGDPEDLRNGWLGAMNPRKGGEALLVRVAKS